jgi:YHS domain-containing protein
MQTFQDYLELLFLCKADRFQSTTPEMAQGRRLMSQRQVFLVVLVFFMCAVSSAVAVDYFERDGLAIDGYDPVAYFTEHKPVKGSAQFRSDFQGSTFRFASAAHRDAFDADPAKYAPRYGGYCAYGMAKGYKAKIDPEAFSVIHGILYLNYSESIRTRWLSDVPGYIRQADANWPTVQTDTKVQE